MSREILFRAKTKQGDWLYWNELGEINFDLTDIEISLYIHLLNDELMFETIGQFTGLTDRNGKKIFEGDIVQGTIVSAWNKALIRCEVVYNKDGFISVERTRNHDWIHKVKFAKDIEIVGNIHDNPELLGE